MAQPALNQGTREARIAPFANITFDVYGELRPGVPIVISATLIGQYAAGGIRMELDQLDLDPDSVSASGGARQRRLAGWSGSLGTGSSKAVLGVVTFARAGYYRVLARAASDPVADAPDGTKVLREARQSLWLLVLPEGGRVTVGWDSTAVDTAYVFSYGAYGPRIRKGARRSPDGAKLMDAAVVGSDITGTIKYINGGTGLEVPVRGGVISGTCYGRSSPMVLEYDLFSSYSAGVGTTGGFVISCPSGYEFADGTYTMTGLVSVGKGKLGAFAGTWLAEYTGTSGLTLFVNNDVAASAFAKLEEYVPGGFAKFGTSRSPMTIYASETAADASDNINYCRPEFSGCPPGIEVLRMNPTRAYGEEGVFTTLHEYGHGYQWVAIEPWLSACTGEHTVAGASSLPCAFVEGFADFFAAWVGGGGLTTGVATYDDHRAEDNFERMVGNGSLIEGAVAGLFYDMVDGSGDPNGPQNETGPDDDAATWPGSMLVQVLQSCWLQERDTGTVFTLLDGVDQFVYCRDFPTITPPFDPQTAIDPATGQRFFATGRLYQVIQVVAGAPPTYSYEYMRQLWLFNLFGEGAL